MLKRLFAERIRLIERARLVTHSRENITVSIARSLWSFFLFTLSLLLSFFLFNRIPSLDSTLDGLRLNDMISPLYSVPSSSNVYLSRFSFLFFFTLLISLSSPRLYLESLQDDAIALFPFPFVPTNLNLFILGSFFFPFKKKERLETTHEASTRFYPLKSPPPLFLIVDYDRYFEFRFVTNVQRLASAKPSKTFL